MTTTQDRIAKLERLLNAISRDAQTSEDFETMDSISRTVEAARETLCDLAADLEPEVESELIAA
jgi:NADH:ubiquinone oxidoreductase subunit F (NADH-binding)